MIGKTIEKYAGILYDDPSIEHIKKNETRLTTAYLSKDPNEAKLMIATSLAFLAGVIHVRTYFYFCLKKIFFH